MEDGGRVAGLDMTWQVTPYTVPLGLAILVASVAAYAVWRRRDSHAEFWGTLVQATIVAWAMLHLALVSTTQYDTKVLFLSLVVPLTSCLAATVLGFTLHYTGHGDLLTRRRLALLIGFPVGMLLLSLTNSYHELVFADLRLDTNGSFVELTYSWGPAFIGNAIICYVLTATGIGLLFEKFRHSRNVYRTISFLLLASVSILAMGTVVSTLQVSPFPHYLLLPLLYAVIGVVLVFATTSLRFVRLLPVDRVLSVVNRTDGRLVPLARDVIMEEVDNGIIILDADCRIVDINTTGKKMLATDRAVGRPVSDIVRPDVFREDSALDEIMRGGRRLEELQEQVWVTTPDEERCYDLTISALARWNGELAGYVALLHDITEQKRREERLREREQQLEQRTNALEREKAKLQHQNGRLNQFASTISHDLRNPLNVADGHMELVARDIDGEDGTAEIDAETLGTIRNSHDRMEAIIADTLTLAREGKVITETESVSLAATARAAWKNLDRGEATLVVETETTVESDRERLLSLFENLFRNAIEHGGDDVTIRVDRRGDDGFIVADDGKGIPDDRKDDALERGFSTNQDGTGIGLTIVRDIAGAHGWQIDVEDSDEGGAQFVFTGLDLSGEDGTLPKVDSVERSGTR